MPLEPKPLKMINPAAAKKPAAPAGAEAALSRLGITLPVAAAPVAAYVPTVEVNGLLHVSGQLPFENGAVMVGRLGEDRNIDYGQTAARACGLMILAQIKAALGSLDRVEADPAKIVGPSFTVADPRLLIGAQASNLHRKLVGQ